MTEAAVFGATLEPASGDGPGRELATGAAEAVRKAVGAGQFAPTFRLRSVDKETFAFIDLVAQGPLVVSFYRGSWCDYCELALERLSEIDEELRRLGARQVAIGPPPSDEGQRQRLLKLAFPVLEDPGLVATGSYGLAVTLPEKDRQRYESIGYVPTGGTDRTKWLVSVPATYVVDDLGRVVMAAIDTDYRNRLQGVEILSALKALKSRSLESSRL